MWECMSKPFNALNCCKICLFKWFSTVGRVRVWHGIYYSSGGHKPQRIYFRCWVEFAWKWDNNNPFDTQHAWIGLDLFISIVFHLSAVDPNERQDTQSIFYLCWHHWHHHKHSYAAHPHVWLMISASKCQSVWCRWNGNYIFAVDSKRNDFPRPLSRSMCVWRPLITSTCHPTISISSSPSASMASHGQKIISTVVMCEGRQRHHLVPHPRRRQMNWSHDTRSSLRLQINDLRK